MFLFLILLYLTNYAHFEPTCIMLDYFLLFLSLAGADTGFYTRGVRDTDWPWGRA